MSEVEAAIAHLKQQINDRENALAVARNEQRGDPANLQAEIAVIQAQIDALVPLIPPPPAPVEEVAEEEPEDEEPEKSSRK